MRRSNDVVLGRLEVLLVLAVVRSNGCSMCLTKVRIEAEGIPRPQIFCHADLNAQRAKDKPCDQGPDSRNPLRSTVSEFEIVQLHFRSTNSTRTILRKFQSDQ